MSEQKKLHSITWFERNFEHEEIDGVHYVKGTVDGIEHSYSGSTKESAWLLAEAMMIKNGHVANEEMWQMQNKIAALNDTLAREKELQRRIWGEVAERHKSQLLSVYYMLDAVAQAGTHGEKRTVIMYQKRVLETLINKAGYIPTEFDDHGDLPF